MRSKRHRWIHHSPNRPLGSLVVTQFDNPTSPVLLGRGDNGSLLPADTLPSDTNNTVVKNAIRLDLNFANMVGRAVYPFVLM